MTQVVESQALIHQILNGVTSGIAKNNDIKDSSNTLIMIVCCNYRIFGFCTFSD